MVHLLRTFLLFLLAALRPAGEVSARTHYLAEAGGSVPADSRVTAVEARVSVADGRVGGQKAGWWAIRWDDTEAVRVTFDFRNFVDGIDEPAVTVTAAGQSVSLNEGINCSGGYNTVAVEWNPDGYATVLVGERELIPAVRIPDLAPPAGSVSIVGSGPTVESLIVETDDRDFSRLQTALTDEELAEAEMWRYLDRESDPRVAIPGGEYRLAMVPSRSVSGGYDLIYMEGARTNGAYWKRGMRKGTLTPTGYVGYYRLSWVDATGRTLPDESSAELDATARTMRLNFPSLRASLRFTSLP